MENHMMILIGIMLVSGIFGGIVNCYRSTDSQEGSDCFQKHLALGIAASFTVPLFLKLIGSSLLTEPEVALGYLEFGGFCLIAALSSKAFIEKISNRLITDLQATKKNISQL